MVRITRYVPQAGYLLTQHRDVRQYEHGHYTMLYCIDNRSGETKQLRKEWRDGGWRPFRPQEVEESRKAKLVTTLHYQGFWPLEKVALFLLLPYETASRYAGYNDKEENVNG